MTWAGRASERWARLTDMVRRFTVTNTGGDTTWSVEGFRDADDTERDQLDVFHGIGHAARPPADTDTEAIAVNVNARDHHVIVATRDADTLQTVISQVGLAPDETIVFTSNAVLKLTAAGDILIGRIGGNFQRVALEDHTHPIPALAPGSQASYAPGPPAGPSTGASTSNSQHTKVT